MEGIGFDEITHLKEIPAFDHENEANTSVSHVINGGDLDQTAHPLAVGKKYHLFVIYSMEDEEEVKIIVSDIEKTYSLYCMLHERDFEAGVSITQNCQDKIAESMKVLVFLSPHYFQSYHCQEEMKIAKVWSHDVKRNDFIIPVVLKPFEDLLPPEFRYHTYIDAQKTENLARKIYDAFLYDEKAKEKEDMENKNGFRLFEQKALKLFPKNQSGMAWTFPRVVDFNIKEVQDLYNMCADKLNESRLLRWHGLLLLSGRSCGFTFSVSLVFLLMFLGIYYTCIIHYQTDSLGMISAFLYLGAIFLCPGILIGLPTFFTVFRRKLLCTANSDVWKCNNVMKQSGFLALLRGPLFAIGTDCLEIVIIRYDRTKCINYIVTELLRKYPTTNRDHLQGIAAEFVQNAMVGVQEHLLKWDTLKDIDVNHHNTWKNKQCICDIVVPVLEDPSVDKLLKPTVS